MKIDGLARWRATSDVARKFQDGRIFLAGDAAHLMPPNGGFGGNTGIHDAHNLAWKLALVLKGVASPKLLSTYETERKPPAKFTVEQAYTRYVTRTATYLGAKDFQPPANDFNIELGYLYHSPAIVPEGDDKIHDDPRQTFGRTGSRAPHLWLERGGAGWLEQSGGRLSTLDLFGTRIRAARRAGRRGVVRGRRQGRQGVSGLELDAHHIGGPVLRDPAEPLRAGLRHLARPAPCWCGRTASSRGARRRKSNGAAGRIDRGAAHRVDESLMATR